MFDARMSHLELTNYPTCICEAVCKSSLPVAGAGIYFYGNTVHFIGFGLAGIAPSLEALALPSASRYRRGLT